MTLLFTHYGQYTLSFPPLITFSNFKLFFLISFPLSFTFTLTPNDIFDLIGSQIGLLFFIFITSSLVTLFIPQLGQIALPNFLEFLLQVINCEMSHYLTPSTDTSPCSSSCNQVPSQSDPQDNYSGHLLCLTIYQVL